jgi:DNA-binding SARP family transcriptional activator
MARGLASLPPLRLTLLGRSDGQLASGAPVDVPKKAMALLAYLALAPCGACAREGLAALLWGDTPETQARQSLRKTLSVLRQACAAAGEPVLLIGSDTVALDRNAVAVDVHTFERRVAEATPAAWANAAALYRGDLLDGFYLREAAFAEWLTVERERLRGMAIGALEALLAHELRHHRVESAIQVAHRLIALNPLHEAAHGSLMQLYARQGRRDTALQQYRLFADRLWHEVGEKPDAETQTLYSRILNAPASRIPTRPSVLVVEDEIVTREHLVAILTAAGYDVVAAADGADALLRLSGRPFDLILSDIVMPLLDGFKLLEVVRDKRLETPVVFLTGRPGSASEAKALRLGAVDYVTKPIVREVLLRRLANALRARTGAPR